MVKRLLLLPSLLGMDASDALGLAITHAHTNDSLKKIKSATTTERKHSAMYKAGRSY